MAVSSKLYSALSQAQLLHNYNNIFLSMQTMAEKKKKKNRKKENIKSTPPKQFSWFRGGNKDTEEYTDIYVYAGVQNIKK